MLMLVQYKNDHGQDCIFQGTCFKSFQILQITIMYCFEHTNHDIPLIVLF